MKKFIAGVKTWVKKTKLRKRQILIKKINILILAAYNHYLTLYLIDVVKNKIVDLPAFEYLSGRVICTKALKQAVDVVEEYAVKRGVKYINKSYKRCLKHQKAILKGC